MGGADPGETTPVRHGVAFTLLRPTGVRMFYLCAAVFIVLGTAWGVMTLFGLDHRWRVVCGVMSVASLLPGALWLAANGGQMGVMVRAFHPYRRLTSELPHGTPLRGGVRYRADDHLGAVMLELGVPRWGMSRAVVRASWARLCAPGVPRFRTVVEQEFEGAVESIPLTADLLEPELIIPSRHIDRRAAITGLVMLALVWGLTLTFGKSHHVPTLLVLSAVCVWPSVLAWLQGAFMESTAPVAGCGVVRAGARRWTVADAMMIVESRLGARPRVILLGSAGMLVVSFQQVGDPDFVALWQRWNHANPRPELLE